jgi:hypothetical protein
MQTVQAIDAPPDFPLTHLRLNFTLPKMNFTAFSFQNLSSRSSFAPEINNST